MLQSEYLGRKGASGIHQFIINKMPKHDIYIECFMGTGFIASKKKKAKYNYGIEISDILYTDLTMEYLDFKIYCKDVFEQLPILLNISMLAAEQKICIYLDPPYLPETRTCFDKCQYDNELTKDEHIKLLSMLQLFSIKYPNVYILLSGYKSELYMSMLQGWNYFETQSMSRGGKRTESLWCNFGPSDYIKHQYDYVGHNFTDRQRIKRKSKRMVKNLASLSLDERMYLINSINNEFSTS